jgi:hypothetical protein
MFLPLLVMYIGELPMLFANKNIEMKGVITNDKT